MNPIEAQEKILREMYSEVISSQQIRDNAIEEYNKVHADFSSEFDKLLKLVEDDQNALELLYVKYKSDEDIREKVFCKIAVLDMLKRKH